MLKLVQDAYMCAEEPTTIDLDERCRLAAKQMLASALLAERQAYLDAHAHLVDGAGRRLVVANGYAKEAGHDRCLGGRGESPEGGRPPGGTALQLGHPAHLHA